VTFRPHPSTFTGLILLAVAATAGRAGLPDTPDWIGQVDISQIGYGTDVCTAGDVNGDGFSDALVTCAGYPPMGGAFVYHGSASGLAATPSWIGQDGGDGSQYGISGSTAGDVNGDGYDDVIVGCWGYTDGEHLEGAAFVYHGGPSGLSATADWMAESDLAEAYFGRRVRPAGDVNGDGYDDVIVGAYRYEVGQQWEGAAFVFLGSPTGLEVTHTWMYEPDIEFVAAGSGVNGAGDVNGDGYDDIVVGAPSWGGGGRALVFHGSPSGPSPSADWSVGPGMSQSGFGAAVAPAGDVNGDGYADLVVGAPSYDGAHEDGGAAYLYLGSATGLDTTPAWMRPSYYADSQFGGAVCTAGDVNADGYADVIIGSGGWPSGGIYGGGMMLLYYGGPEGLDETHRWLYGGGEPNAYLGRAVAGAGDVNGDGLSDVIVGATGLDDGEFNEGLALLFEGRPDTPVTYPARWTFDGGVPTALVGSDVRHAGDVNGDGLGDFIVNANGHPGSPDFFGRVRVFTGHPSGVPVLNATIDGDQTQEFRGNGIDGAGDVNGDGYADVIVGAPLRDGALTDAGFAFVHLGSPDGISLTPAWTMEGASDGAAFGAYVAGPGDVNGDGYDDVLVGSLYYSGGQENEGRVDLYYGSATGPAASPSWSYESDLADVHLSEVYGVGDLNGDGYADFTAGGYGYDDSHALEGGIFLFYGSASGPASTPDRIFTSDQTSGQMTHATAAGDVDGDGFDDLAIACHNSHGDAGLLVGRIWVYHGSPTGVDAVATTVIEGGTHDEHIGHALHGAGDVNGDGYADLIAGGNYYDQGITNQGVARIYLGSPAGIDADDAWSIVPEQEEARLGTSVSTAGDVNGDGYADVLTGASGYDGTGGDDEGRVYLHLGGCYYNPTGGASVRPRQTRSDGTPLPLGGQTPDGDRIQLHVDARSPVGRDLVQVEWQMAPDGASLDGAARVQEPVVDTGAPGTDGSVEPVVVDVTGLLPETGYQWRMRLRYDSPYVPYSRWMTVAPGTPRAALFRTGSEVLATGGVVAPPVPRLAVHPNPMRTHTSVSLGLDEAGPTRVSVIDVTGREVAVLASGSLDAGSHVVHWDGTTDGVPVASGVYAIRVETPRGVTTAKLVQLR